MSDEELIELKNKADAGDRVACYHYTIQLYYNKKDCLATYQYALKVYENMPVDSPFEWIYANMYTIYKQAFDKHLISSIDDNLLRDFLFYHWKYLEEGFMHSYKKARYSFLQEESELIKLLQLYLDMTKAFNIGDEHAIEFCEFVINSPIVDDDDKAGAKYILAKQLMFTDKKHYFELLNECLKVRMPRWCYYDVDIDKINEWIAICYEKGEGTTQDYTKALEYYLASRKNYDKVAYYYENGIGCEQSFEKAYHYYKRAYSYSRNEVLLAKCGTLLFENRVSRMWKSDNNTLVDIEKDRSSDGHLYIKGIKDFKNQELTDCDQLTFKPNKYLDLVLRNETPRIIEIIELATGSSIFDIEDKLSNINILYSYEEKETNYSIDINELLKGIYDLIEEIEFSENDTYKNLIDILERLLKLLKHSPENKELIHQVLKDFPTFSNEGRKTRIQRKFQSIKSRLLNYGLRTLGEYSNSNFTITLYLKNIYKYSLESGLSKEVCTLNVFAHELFHAFHALRVGSKKWDSSNKHNEIVIESLARYFEYLYTNGAYDVLSSQEEFGNVKSNSIRRYNSESEFNKRSNEYRNLSSNIQESFDGDMMYDPYSGASYIHQTQGRLGWEVFRKVFNDSLSSFDKAYKTLKFLYDLENY